MAKTSINELPVELILECGEYMDPVSRSRFSQTCKFLYKFFCEQRKDDAVKHADVIQNDYKPSGLGNWMANPEWVPKGENERPPEQRDGPVEGPVSQVVLAIHEGRAGVLRGYLEAGVDPNSFWGESRLLSEAACACFENTECVQVLIEHGADPALVDKDQERTPLGRALCMVFRPSAMRYTSWDDPILGQDWKPEYDKVTRLIKAGVKITRVCELGYLLMQVNALDVLKLAVEYGSDLSKLEHSSGYPETALHYVVGSCSGQERYGFQWPPGSGKIHDNKFAVVEWLIAMYPELMGKLNWKGLTAFDLGYDYLVHRPDVSRLILLTAIERGFSEEPWCSEFLNGETDIKKIELLLETRQEINNYDWVMPLFDEYNY